MGPIGCPETSVRNCHYTLRNITELDDLRWEYVCERGIVFGNMIQHMCRLTLASSSVVLKLGDVEVGKDRKR